MSNFAIIHDAVYDFHYGEFAELRLSMDSIIWAGLDYDDNVVIGYADSDGVHIVRASGQTLDEILGE